MLVKLVIFKLDFFLVTSASIIEQLDVEINGQTRFTCNNYGLLYNTLFDYTAAQDSLNRRKVGENAVIHLQNMHIFMISATGDEFILLNEEVIVDWSII